MEQLSELIALVGESHVLVEPALKAQYEEDWRGRYHGVARAVVRPADTEQVAQVVRWCAENDVAIVTQGGNTGLCGGATPDDSGQAIILSTERLNKIRSIDTQNDTMVVEAGCILQVVQDTAQAHNRLFPLSLAAEGSCTIGGNLATNAGGTQVLRYGNARDLVLGLEVVTAQGEIMHSLRALRKDNTGYDLRNLFIGSEGTLGIITAATLALFPQPVAQCTAMLALESIEDAITMLGLARQGFGAALTGFEVMARNCLEAVVECYPEQRLPFQGPSAEFPWFALLELSDSESEEHARERFEAVLGTAIEQGVIQDAVIAESGTQSAALWHLRESIPLAERTLGTGIKHDISIPVSHFSEFIEQTNQALQEFMPGVIHVIFGHLGDGNLHYNVMSGQAYSESELVENLEPLSKIVHDAVHRFGGSISAEHGIGQLKRDWLPHYKDPVELALMHSIKQALDPKNILNPGKLLAVSSDSK